MRPRKTVTIRDVAAHLGVSNMTVSNALSSDARRRGKVSEATRARVLAAIEQMEYRPNATARSLRLRRTNIIGLYSGYNYLSPENAFIAAIIGGVQQECDHHRKDLLLHGVYRGRTVKDIYAELVDGRIDGLIVQAPPGDPLLELLAEAPLPVVALAEATPLLPSVVVDDRAGGQLTAEYLAAKGHRWVLYHQTHRQLSSAQNRLEGFLEMANRLRLRVNLRPDHSLRSGFQLSEEAAAWLDTPANERPTAAVCWNDPAAYELLVYCHRRGLRVPQDVAIVGFDGVIRSVYPDWQLTTVFAPWAEAAREAVRLLIRRIEGDTIPQETVLPVTFRPGNTA
jgi:DNA-binding LacI/PurR family transcriptional regulator